jgi:glycosyltransferase involved in cell wall biosynthesis
MKLGFDAKRALNNSTGLGNHARILLNAMMRDFPENEYHLFSPKAKDKFFHQLHGDFKIHFPQTKWQQIANPLWRSFSIKSDLLRNRIDVYHGLSNEIPFSIHKTGVASVVTIHDLIFLKHKEQYPWIDRQFYETKTRYAAKHADHIIAVSEETKRDLIELYGAKEKKIAVIYPSVERNFQNDQFSITNDQTTAKYNLPAKYILNVGSFFPRKNQKTLIEAFDNIKNKVEEHLVLVGSSGTQKEEIQQLITSKNLSDRVHLITNISNDDLPAVYRNASVFVFPSLFEGFGAPVLEALFSKVPVIATKGNAIEEAAGCNSLLINPLSAEEIAEALLQVLSNESLRNKMINESYEHALKMTDTVFAKKTMGVYGSL